MSFLNLKNVTKNIESLPTESLKGFKNDIKESIDYKEKFKKELDFKNLKPNLKDPCLIYSKYINKKLLTVSLSSPLDSLQGKLNGLKDKAKQATDIKSLTAEFEYKLKNSINGLKSSFENTKKSILRMSETEVQQKYGISLSKLKEHVLSIDIGSVSNGVKLEMDKNKISVVAKLGKEQFKGVIQLSQQPASDMMKTVKSNVPTLDMAANGMALQGLCNKSLPKNPFKDKLNMSISNSLAKLNPEIPADVSSLISSKMGEISEKVKKIPETIEEKQTKEVKNSISNATKSEQILIDYSVKKKIKQKAKIIQVPITKEEEQLLDKISRLNRIVIMGKSYDEGLIRINSLSRSILDNFLKEINNSSHNVNFSDFVVNREKKRIDLIYFYTFYTNYYPYTPFGEEDTLYTDITKLAKLLKEKDKFGGPGTPFNLEKFQKKIDKNLEDFFKLSQLNYEEKGQNKKLNAIKPFVVKL